MRLLALVLLLCSAALSRAGACDEKSNCDRCLLDTDCDWCLLDGTGLCFPRSWDVCPVQERSCSPAVEIKQRDLPSHPESTVSSAGAGPCRPSGASLFPCAPFIDTWQSECTVTSTGEYFSSSKEKALPLSCEVCFAGHDEFSNQAELDTDINAYECFAPWEGQPYAQQAACGPLLETTTTADADFSKWCFAIESSFPGIIVVLDPSSYKDTDPSFYQVIEASFQKFLASNGLTSNHGVLDLSTLTTYQQHQWVMACDNLVLPAVVGTGLSITKYNIFFLGAALVPQSRRRDQLSTYNIQLTLAVVKGQDPTDPTLNAAVQQAASNIAEGASGIDPVSVTFKPGTRIVQSGNSTSTTPTPTEIVRPRNPASSLSGGALFGIIFGSAVGLLLLTSAGAYLYNRRRRLQRPPFDPPRAA